MEITLIILQLKKILKFSKLQEISITILTEVNQSEKELGRISTEKKLLECFTELSRSSLPLPNRSYWVYSRPSWGTAQGAWPDAWCLGC